MLTANTIVEPRLQAQSLVALWFIIIIANTGSTGITVITDIRVMVCATASTGTTDIANTIAIITAMDITTGAITVLRGSRAYLTRT